MKLTKVALVLGLALLGACGGTTPAPTPVGNEPSPTEVTPDRAGADDDGGGGSGGGGGGGQDRDADGLADDVDKCPDAPEDRDAFQDADGCPDQDNDQDGVLDVDDLCPSEPEDRDGNQDDDGCPE